MPSMKKEIRDKWIANLRSGKYPQAKRRLRTRDGLCCLGVLTELGVGEGVMPEGTFIEGSFRYGEANEGAELPLPIAVWAGLITEEDLHGPLDNCPMPDYSSDRWQEWHRFQSELVRMNDGRPDEPHTGSTFLEIANYIEQNVEVTP